MRIKVKCPNCNEVITIEMPKCKDCVYLNGNRTTVGIKCTNPSKQWSRSLSMYKQSSNPACSMFTPKEGSNIIGIEVEDNG